LIAILAGGRALLAYVRTLCGEKPRWEKTFHHAHPAAAALRELAA
jgi:adsorption protein B